MKNAWPGSLGASSPSNQCFGEGCYFGIAEYVGFLEDANTVAQCNITTSDSMHVLVVIPLRPQMEAPSPACSSEEFAEVRTV